MYPQVESYSRPLTRLQERLIKKLGANAFPFFFEMPANTPASVTLQPAPGDTGKPCGVDYELKTYVSDPLDQDKPHKRSSVRLAIRKLTYAPGKGAGSVLGWLIHGILLNCGQPAVPWMFLESMTFFCLILDFKYGMVLSRRLQF